MCPAVLTFVHAAMGAMQTYHQEGEDFVASRIKPHGFLDGSQFANMTYKPYDMCALRNFAYVATCHYNFLDNLARDELYKYDFGTWDLNAFKYERWSINTIMFKGSDLNREVISEDDELSISETLLWSCWVSSCGSSSLCNPARCKTRRKDSSIEAV